MPIGSVKMYDTEKGFGFIQPDDGGTDVFFHFSAVREGEDEIREGAKVSFEVGQDRRTGKTKAVSVELSG